MNVVLDDHMLRTVLIEGTPGWLRRRRPSQLITTGSWYYRLCHAMSGGDLVGALSGPVELLDSHRRLQVLRSIVRLPPEIAVHSMREVSWPASELANAHGLNLLAAEALGVALLADAAIVTAGSNLPPRLAKAAELERVRVITPPG